MTGMVTMSQFTADPNAAHSPQSLTGSRASSAPRTIVVTEKLPHLLKQVPDRGTRVLMMVARRQLLRAAECSQKLQAILYDIFLLPANGQFILELMRQGKRHAQKVKFHKHSLGAPPIYAFGILLLLAAGKNNWVIDSANTEALDLNSKGVLNRLCHAARYYDHGTHKLALTFRFGHDYQQLIPAVLAEIKKLQGCPWPVVLHCDGATTESNKTSSRMPQDQGHPHQSL